jgi:hypothetical protein
MICLGLGGRKKHTHTTDKLILQVQTSIGGSSSLSQLTPGDISPAHGVGSPTPGLVPPVDDLVRLQPPLLCLLGLGSPLLLGRRSFLLQPTPPLSMLTPLPPASARRRAAEVFSLTKQEKPWVARPTEPRDSYASGIRIPHSSPSAQGNSHLVKRSS